LATSASSDGAMPKSSGPRRLAGWSTNRYVEGEMGIAERFYEAFMVRDYYTMGLLYASHATFSDPVFPRLTAQGARLMWQMLLSEAEDLEIDVKILEDTPDRARVDWSARYTFTPTKRVVVNRVHTELGWKGWLLGFTPLVQDKVRGQAARSLKEFAQFVALTNRQVS
jgi:hypothetical protein